MTFAQTEKLPQNEQEAKALVASRAQAIEAVRAESLVLLEGMKSSRDTIAGEGWQHKGPGYCPPKISAYEDLRFNDPLVPYEKMTKHEQLLAWGYPAKMDDAGGAFIVPNTLAIAAYGQYDYLGRTTPDLLWQQNSPVWSMDFLKENLAMLISPVTGKLIEVDHKEFSPGNAYVRVVTPDEVKALVAKDSSVDEWWNYCVMAGGTNDPPDSRITLTGKEVRNVMWGKLSGKHPAYVVYVRIYGEKGVLAEGLY